MLQEAHAKLLQQLLMSWIEAISESPEQYGLSYAMQLVLKYDLREQGPRLAHKVLENPDTSVQRNTVRRHCDRPLWNRGRCQVPGPAFGEEIKFFILGAIRN